MSEMGKLPEEIWRAACDAWGPEHIGGDLEGAVQAALAIIERGPDPDHAWQEWNEAGNSCHVRNCRLEFGEHKRD